MSKTLHEFIVKESLEQEGEGCSPPFREVRSLLVCSYYVTESTFACQRCMCLPSLIPESDLTNSFYAPKGHRVVADRYVLHEGDCGVQSGSLVGACSSISPQAKAHFDYVLGFLEFIGRRRRVQAMMLVIGTSGGPTVTATQARVTKCRRKQDRSQKRRTNEFPNHLII